MAYESFYLPVMRYSLSVTSINQMDFETIQKNATNSLLSALGYNRHMPREVVFCTQKFQGIGFKHMYDLQGTDGVRLLLQELNFKEGSTNKMIRVLLEVIQQEAGIQAPILEENRPLQYIEWGWIPSIRDFLYHINAQITNATAGLEIYRVNDSLIIDAPIIQTMTRKEQILINRCRIFLQVECVSDIASADGRQILEAWTDNRLPKPSRSTKRWPIQGDPGKEAWTIWKQFLIKAFIKADGTLKMKLGEWFQRNRFRTHEAYWSQSHKVTLTQDTRNNLWRHHPLFKAGRRQYLFTTQHLESSELPSDATPIDLIRKSPTTYTTGKPTPARKYPSIRRIKSFSDLILSRATTNFFSNVKLTMDDEYIRGQLQRTALIDTATDGGYEPTSGITSYGWVMSINETVVAKGQGPAEAHPIMADAYRGEAYGLAAATTVIQEMIEFFDIQPSKHRWFFHIDNKAIIRRMESYINETITPKWMHFPDIDVTNIAHEKTKNLTPQFLHVKGHQTNQKSGSNISFPAQLNTMADALATRQRGTMKKPEIILTGNHSHLRVGNIFVTRDSQRWLMEFAGKIPIQKYYHDRHGWTRNTFESIDWELQWKVLNNYDINDQREF